jgi:hypothetical protein
MPEFQPVDHKDSDQSYRTQVRAVVSEIIGSELIDVVDSSSLIGEWRCSFPRAPTLAPFTRSYFKDGTFASPFDKDGIPAAKWEIELGMYTEITWCEPMPEYGMDEGTWNYTTHHCAVTSDGSIAMWNGDASYLLLLKRKVG